MTSQDYGDLARYADGLVHKIDVYTDFAKPGMVDRACSALHRYAKQEKLNCAVIKSRVDDRYMWVRITRWETSDKFDIPQQALRPEGRKRSR